MTTATPIQPGPNRPVSPSEQPWLTGGRTPPTSRLQATARRRGLPYLLLGAVLVLICAGGFVLISLHSGDRQYVLALAREVSVGQVLTAQDLRQVSIAIDPGIAVLSADRASAVVGRPMATSLSAGSLLTSEAVGPAAIPTDGQALAALALEPGRFPPEVAAGSRVSVVFAPDPAASAGSLPDAGGTAWPAVVTGVTTAPNEQLTVVSVQLSEAAARQVAAVAAGRLSIVLLSGGGR